MTDLTVVPPIETTCAPPYDQDEPESYDIDVGAITRIIVHNESGFILVLSTLVALVESLGRRPLSEVSRAFYCERLMSAIEATR